MMLGKLAINMQKNELYPYLASYAKIKLKWIKHLSVRTKTVKHFFILFFCSCGLQDFKFSDQKLNQTTAVEGQNPKH